MWHLGGKFINDAANFNLKRDIVSIFIGKDSPTPLDIINNVQDRELAYSFYENLTIEKNKTITYVFDKIVGLFNQSYVFRTPEQNIYYKLKLESPYVVVNYTDIPILSDVIQSNGRKPESVKFENRLPQCMELINFAQKNIISYFFISLIVVWISIFF